MHMQKEETTGDHQEFDEMYRRTQAEIYKFIRYRVADKELAKDVLQETYYVAYKKWDILCEHSNPMGWLINTAKNKIRELNKSLKKIECEVDLDADEYTFTEDGYGKSELDLIITKGLTEEEKNRFYKYFLHGYSISELAQLEKISENNMSLLDAILFLRCQAFQTYYSFCWFSRLLLTGLSPRESSPPTSAPVTGSISPPSIGLTR